MSLHFVAKRGRAAAARGTIGTLAALMPACRHVAVRAACRRAPQATPGWRKPVPRVPHEGAHAVGLFTSNLTQGRLLNSFRPATLVVALSLAFASQISHGADAAPGAAPAGTELGLDKAGMDPAVRPQDDLFLAMNGTWIKNTEIPADRTAWGPFYQLRSLSEERVRGLVEDLSAKPQDAGSANGKIRDYYASYMDTVAIDAAGTAPLAAYKAQLAAAKSKKDLAVLMGRWSSFADMPMSLGVGPDARDPTVYSAGTGQGGLGLDNRDYYIKTDAHFAKSRADYLAYMRTLLALDGDKHAVMDANAVLALETRIAKAQWSQVQLRDPVKTYNPMTLQALAAKTPGFDWKAWAAAADVSDPAFLSISQPSYAWTLVKLLQDQPIDVWKAYLRVRLLDANARVLPAGFREASYQFHDVAMNGLKQDLPRWKRAVESTNAALGEAVGQLYVAKYFPPAYKARMVELVDNLMKAYAQSIDGLTWMGAATKAEAHAKLAKYSVKIGYPDVWRDYGALDVKVGDPVGNRVRASQFEQHRQAVRNGRKVDRAEWEMTPQTVNAYYEPTKNEVVFPAAILQEPLFNMKADDAVNYGGIGAIIGHEISHGFDDQGSQYDGDGKVRNWWTAEDRKAFEAVTSKLDAQYSAYEPVPGAHVNGKQTMGENIADLSGLQIAFKAWKLSLNGQPAPVIDGLTGEQRFVYAFAQDWRSKTREERARQLVSIDFHSPNMFRADGTAINLDAFHDAFGTKPGDKMWKAPEERLRLW